tara:strand:- start:212 stop:790 length:579 start_codon:yes stop_codon:yes gene_type:complete
MVKLFKSKINLSKFLKIIVLMLAMPVFLSSCKSPDGKFKLPGGDARKFPADPAKRVEQNLKEGRGFKLNDAFTGPKTGVFDFASSNELWRASLDTIDFMPLLSVNYSGGIIVTDWYSDEQSASGESVKISIRFLTNEVRSDALDIKVFSRKCNNVSNCIVKEINDELAPELKKQILKKATLYKKETKSKDKN